MDHVVMPSIPEALQPRAGVEQLSNGVEVSLVIPAYNEALRIGRSLDQILSFLQRWSYRFELVIVDDHSRDRTSEVVRERCGDHPAVRLIRHSRNLGKGAAVQRGMLAATGEFVVFSDADLSVPIETIEALVGVLKDGADVAIGTRRHSESRIEVHQPRYREFMGTVYRRLANDILGLRVSDFTCGFKAFRRVAAQDIFAKQRLANWSFDAEIVYLAHRLGWRVAEVPVRWRNNRKTKVRLWRDVVTSFWGLVQIRAFDLAGQYARSVPQQEYASVGP